jgi:hypothetical protein
MKYQRAVLPPRTDLTSRPKLVAAKVMGRGLDLYERLKSRLLEKYRREGVDVTYQRFRSGGHSMVAFAGVPASLRFLGRRFRSPTGDA